MKTKPNTNATRKINLNRCGHCGYEEVMHAPAASECPRCGRPASQRYDRWISACDILYANGVPVSVR